MSRKVIIKDYYFRGNVKNNIKICLISDIHISNVTNFDNLNLLKEEIIKLNPHYIIIAGDIIDCLDYVKDNNIMNNFYNWLNDLGSITKVIAVIGNHDMKLRKKSNFNYKDEINLYNKYIKDLSKTKIILLDNNYYEDKDIFIYGFTQPINSFHNKDSLNIEREYYNSLNKHIFYKKNKFMIGIIHSPINIVDDNIQTKLQNYNLLLAGHMHNGLILPILDNNSNYGFISPGKKLFPKVSRGAVKLNNNNNLIISGGITKLSSTAGIFHYGNILFPMEIDNIVIEKNLKN